MAALSSRTGAREKGGSRRESIDPADVEAAAQRLGIEQLHPEQEHVLDGVFAGRDVLMVLPTGFGKSACYQIPSMVLPQPVLVISPLLALMRDQEEKLLARDIPVVRMDGTVRGKKRVAAFERIAAGGPLLVMTTPETADAPELGEALANSGISMVAVDEAHCISEWGHDFRPAYRRLGPRLREMGGPPVLALTATATPHVRDSIVKTLRMRDPSVVADSPHRDNLAFEVLWCEGDARLRALVRLVRRLRRPGIVYCTTTREVDEVYTILRRFKVPATRYHGKMTAAERNKEQASFMRRGRRSVMIATNAFGLGIDKSDIRYVLHAQSPASLEQYVQEAGRGGRDGRRANAILLFDESNRAMHELLLSRSRVRPDQLYRLGSALSAWADEGRAPSMEALALSADMGPRIAAALLATLEEAGLVRRQRGVEEIEILCPPDSIEQETRTLASQFERLKREDSRRLDAVAAYADAGRCRAQFLQDYFGEDEGEPCGLCDACLQKSERPSSFFAPIFNPNPPKRKKTRSGKGRGRGRSRGDGQRGDGQRGESRRGEGRRGGRRRRGGRAASGEGADAANAQTREAGADGARVDGARRRRGRRGGRRRGRRGGRGRPRGDAGNESSDEPRPEGDGA